jgi:putative hydrolase of the HAD superfamily
MMSRIARWRYAGAMCKDLTMKTNGAATETSVLLFDVGGVLVELSGVETMLGWLGGNITTDELWRMWLQSKSVRDFETGRVAADEFAASMIEEFRLPVGRQQFLTSFTGWPTGLFPGTLEMLARIPSAYRRALLSNSNVLHWTRMVDDLQLGAVFDHHFASHLTGRIKPDADAFEHVVTTLSCRPEQVLFLDDNTLNIDAANRFGMQAVRVRGIDETARVLIDRGVIDS